MCTTHGVGKINQVVQGFNLNSLINVEFNSLWWLCDKSTYRIYRLLHVNKKDNERHVLRGLKTIIDCICFNVFNL